MDGDEGVCHASEPGAEPGDLGNGSADAEPPATAAARVRRPKQPKEPKPRPEKGTTMPPPVAALRPEGLPEGAVVEEASTAPQPQDYVFVDDLRLVGDGWLRGSVPAASSHPGGGGRASG